MARPVVDFPQPLSPTRPRVSPCLMVIFTPSTAFTWAFVLPNSPPRTGKWTFKSFTSSSVVPAATSNESCIKTLLSRSEWIEACSLLAFSYRLQRRCFYPAARLHLRAAWRKGASWRQVHQIRRLPLDGRQAIFLVVFQMGDGIEERFGVRVGRVGEQLAGGSLFNNMTSIHHPHTLAHPSNHTQVMG